MLIGQDDLECSRVGSTNLTGVRVYDTVGGGGHDKGDKKKMCLRAELC